MKSNQDISQGKGTVLTAIIVLFAALLVVYLSGRSYRSMLNPPAGVDMVKPQAGFKQKMLSDYFEGIKDTPADTPVYVQEGKEKGGTVLLLGGTHANEPAAMVAGVVVLENARVEKGRLIVIPFNNPMGREHTTAQEGHPKTFTIAQKKGKGRVFRYGSRGSNPIHEWPNPDIYVHPASGQKLAGSERSNLNRCYPGRPDGHITEKLAYAIIQLIKKEKVDLAFDLHEASPEYPVVNAIVAHERAMELAAMVMMELEASGVPMRLEPSPARLRGLSHREWGDSTETLAILMETANPSQGRFRGKTDERLVLTGEDKAYKKAAALGHLYIPYKGSQTIDLRVARHVFAVKTFMEMLEFVKPDKGVIVQGLPDFQEMLDRKTGAFLAGVEG
ncbi:succinylglutamate desuccinylase/aspartoacylase family protein [Dethiosulfatarculus sandiegensis]|uniref:Succinylglutamate desuccinylase n=1 Tax=Dethiosulfatarculus sandiegensis TaxID=1429043 RepID=A0A0D2HJ79_9BACT|nr:succinylglutamate desuccinylase/aspartoacylase family protein [Dethiosulfatarculus sandiegensis]KIX10733.1 succinylglutamate desuccinylase [Dethiosulfatarculus sandiegensis]